MADGLTVTVTGGTALVAELDAMLTHVVPEGLATVTKGAQNIKTDWRRRSSGIRHAPRYPRSVDYDAAGDWRGIRAEIGPQDSPDDQGFLGQVLEMGGLHNAPRPDGAAALAAEAPRYEAAVEALARKLLPS